jgi:hypothetical protein
MPADANQQRASITAHLRVRAMTIVRVRERGAISRTAWAAPVFGYIAADRPLVAGIENV